MDQCDIAILGFDLNALSIAADAATRGYRVKLIAADNVIGHHKLMPLPIIASRFMYPECLTPLFLLNCLNEQKILYNRSPRVCQWVPAFVRPKTTAQPFKSKLTSYFYQQLYQWHQLPELMRSYEDIDHNACIINTNLLMAANKSLAESWGATIETGMKMIEMRKKDNVWHMDLINSEKNTQQIEALAIINCTGIPVLNVCKHWFGLDSRCQTKLTWHNSFTYHPKHPIKELHYLTDIDKSCGIYFSVDINKAVISINAKKNQNYQQNLEQAQLILKHYDLPALTNSNIEQQCLVPEIQLITNDHDSHDYMIDFICPEGSHPVINIISNNTAQCRLVAEQAINNLTDYLPKCKPCQTRTLSLPV